MVAPSPGCRWPLLSLSGHIPPACTPEPPPSRSSASRDPDSLLQSLSPSGLLPSLRGASPPHPRLRPLPCPDPRLPPPAASSRPSPGRPLVPQPRPVSPTVEVHLSPRGGTTAPHSRPIQGFSSPDPEGPCPHRTNHCHPASGATAHLSASHQCSTCIPGASRAAQPLHLLFCLRAVVRPSRGYRRLPAPGGVQPRIPGPSSP